MLYTKMKAKEFIPIFITVWSFACQAQVWGPRSMDENGHTSTTQVTPTLISVFRNVDSDNKTSATESISESNNAPNGNDVFTSTNFPTSVIHESTQFKDTVTEPNRDYNLTTITTTSDRPNTDHIPKETQSPTNVINDITTIKHDVNDKESMPTTVIAIKTEPSTKRQKKSSTNQQFETTTVTKTLDNTVKKASVSTPSTSYSMSSTAPVSTPSTSYSMSSTASVSTPSSSYSTSSTASVSTPSSSYSTSSSSSTTIASRSIPSTIKPPASSSVHATEEPSSSTTENIALNSTIPATYETTVTVSATFNAKSSKENTVVNNNAGNGTMTTNMFTTTTRVQPPNKTRTSSTTKYHTSTETHTVTTPLALPYLDNSTEVATNTTIDPERLNIVFTDEDTSDSFWPVVVALTIAVPSVVVFGVTITVLYRRRMAKPRRPYSMDYSQM